MPIRIKTLSPWEGFPYNATVTVDTDLPQIINITLKSKQEGHDTEIHLIPNQDHTVFALPRVAYIDRNEVDISEMHTEGHCTVQDVHFGSELLETIFGSTNRAPDTELKFTPIWEEHSVKSIGAVPTNLDYYDTI